MRHASRRVVGVVPAALPGPPTQLVFIHGSAEAITAPDPMKKLCIAKPRVRSDASRRSATNARNGSMEMLIEASRIQRSPAAIQRLLDIGIAMSAQELRMAPTRKK